MVVFDNMNLDKESLEFIVIHVILPPRLPQCEDQGQSRKEEQLVRLVITHLTEFAALCPTTEGSSWRSVIKMLHSWVKANEGGAFIGEILAEELKNFNADDFLFLHLKAQNTGILIRGEDRESVLFECFEASPQCDKVMETTGRLVRTFPGRTVSIPKKVLLDDHFRNEFAASLQRLHIERVDIAKCKTKKADSDVVETRDTADPMLVSEKLFNLLAALGEARDSENLVKHTRDDVVSSNIEDPWRRSPLWLVLRVVIQTSIYYAFEKDLDHFRYKNFMLYLICAISKHALEAELKPDTQLVISSKIARRLAKLGDGSFQFVSEIALKSSQATNAMLNNYWSEVTGADAVKIPSWNIPADTKETSLELSKSQKYLKSTMSDILSNSTATTFQPLQEERMYQDYKILPTFKTTAEESCVIPLADLEWWVENCLRQWLNSGRKSAIDCTSLSVLISTYSTTALQQYREDPRELSYAILTIVQLWVALDKVCVQLHPLLQQYNPEIPPTFLEPLLLPDISQMFRQQEIENYLQTRWANASESNVGIFTPLKPTSFAVRFFNESLEHQDLKAKIEKQATENRKAKEEEWRAKSATYATLVQQATQIPHSFVKDDEDDEDDGVHHIHACRKCQLETQAQNLSILLDEWPLPTNTTKMRAVVFELSCPVAFVAWRDSTWLIVQTIGRTSASPASDLVMRLHQYRHLQEYTLQGRGCFTLGSRTKSFVEQTHYKVVNFPVQLEFICVENGLSYELLIDVQPVSVWAAEQTEIPNIGRLCTLQLPPSPYSTLQWAVDSTEHQPNEVIARQDECPLQLKRREFLEFGSLRSGELIQWHNILRELGCPNLSFNEEAVNVLILQAAWQAGRSDKSDVRRQAHVVLRDSQLCEKLLNLLSRMLDAITASWKEQQSFSIIVNLALRALSLTLDSGIGRNAISLLRRARGIALDWCHNLTTYVHEGTNHEESDRMRRLLLQAANNCLTTFDIGTKHIDAVLETDNDIASLIESSILVRNNTPVHTSNLSLLLRCQLFHSEKVRHALEPSLRALVTKSSKGIDMAIKSVWHGVSFQGPWRFLPGKEKRWATNSTANIGCERSVQAHYNLLTGELLADGQPLGQVPHSFMKNPLFKALFDTRILNVFTSDMPGMQYMVAREIFGHQIHLGMKSDQLLIRARAYGRVLEALPLNLFAIDLPNMFARKFIHWLDLATGEIEFRPLNDIWQPSELHWRLRFVSGSPSTMFCQQKHLLESRTEITRHIIRVLEVLDDYLNIHITRTDNGLIEVELPRLRLHFFLNCDGRLQSRELAAIVDQDQTIGCFWGLNNKLVLEDAANHGIRKVRSVIIPFGDVGIQKCQEHVQVNIDTGYSDLVHYYRYSLDTYLRKIRGPPDLLGNLFKAYLHAVTTFVLPDHFTGRIGQEEALSNLREESMRSCFPLTEDVQRVLKWISRLTPHRSFYPENLRVMQQIIWNNDLSPLVQHEDFDKLACDILTYAERFTNFHQAPPLPEIKTRGDSYLQRRSAYQNARHRKNSLGEANPISDHDLVYLARDTGGANVRGRRVYEVAATIKCWPSRLDVVSDLAPIMRDWGTVSGYHQDFRVKTLSELLNLSFCQNWGSLYDLCRNSSRESDTYRLMFLFCTIVFDQPESPRLIRTLLACAFSGVFSNLAAPQYRSFNLSLGNSADLQKLKQAIRGNQVDFLDNVPVTGSQRQRKTIRQERRNAHDSAATCQMEELSSYLLKQWPCKELSAPLYMHLPLIRVPAALRDCQSLYDVWFQNRQFIKHLEELQYHLQNIRSMTIESFWKEPPQALKPCARVSRIRYPSLTDLMATAVPPNIPSSVRPLVIDIPHKVHETGDEWSELQTIIADFRSHTDTLYQEYGQNLEESLLAWEKYLVPVLPCSVPYTQCTLQIHESEAKSQVVQVFDLLEKALSPASTHGKVMREAGLWPTLTPHSLLYLLSVQQSSQLDDRWKGCLLTLAQAIAIHQRSERLLKLSGRQDILGFFKEIEERGRENWDPRKFSVWLLMEIENNFTIRKIQARVALDMISSKSGGNSVLQLNMGEGKSSVILPMCVAAMADQQQLVRVLVLKPLLLQTQILLSQRLGGLVNRRIYHTPFLRRTPLDLAIVENLGKIYSDCMKSRGVLIALPEHVLSFRLMGLERLTRDRALSQRLLSTEAWLQQYCRDVLDESDELLDTRFQLVYTVGSQQMMDGSPDRWLICQDLLALVDDHVDVLREKYPDWIDFSRREGSFPMISHLTSDAAKELLSVVLDDVLNGRIGDVSFHHCSARVRQRIRCFIQDRHASAEDAKVVREVFDGSVKSSSVLLLRGLLAHGILLHALRSKRWLVDYGLDTSRCLMAVPYRAKGVPSPSSEFGHPDVAIVLTCLSYYFTGLTWDQLRHSLELLLKESNSSDEYVRWCENITQLPERLRSLEAVNLDDVTLCASKLFPHLQYNMRAINFFLSRVVFPREGKEFRRKISSSAWDIPSTAGSHRTVGFSGTNDNRLLLPLSIKQCDLDELHHTNAMVLRFLLKPENRGYHHMRDESGKKISVESLLSLISKQLPPIRVLLDVGAQVLEMNNLEVVKIWLEFVPEAKAAIFFDSNHDARVVDRDGNEDRLISSSFHQRMGDCLIYLDEVHTRGIDLAIPLGVKAAVTLGPRLTKDKLVQAAMRMRKLGHGHSLAFFAPPEVHQEIVSISKKSSAVGLDSNDVIRWAMEQTCRTAKNARPLWALQGLEHTRRTRCRECLTLGYINAVDACSDHVRVDRFWDEIQEPEARTLQEMYGVGASVIDPSDYILPDPRSEEITLLRILGNLDQNSLVDAAISEEQEREIAHEVERERQVHRPPQMIASPHKLDPNVENFVTHGVIHSMMTAFDNLARTSASIHLEPHTPCADLRVSSDFMKTVHLHAEDQNDDYLRPVRWLLTSILTNEVLIISPYEANEIIRRVETSPKVRLHIYSPKITKAMVSFSDLDFYTTTASRAEWDGLPLILRCGLGAFAGCLYFDTFTQYQELCAFLGIATEFIPHSKTEVSCDGFVNESTRQSLGWSLACTFKASPLPLLKKLMAMRAFGDNISKTHVGKIITGNVLTPGEFQ